MYSLLPHIKAKYPHIKIVDELFNETGHLKNNVKSKDYIDLTIVENRKVEEVLVDKNNVDKDKVKIIESGIDINKLFNPLNVSKKESLKKFNLSEGMFKVLFLGRLSIEKSPQKFVQIANKLKDNKNLLFLMAGEGPMRGDIEKQITEANLYDKVKLLGNVDSKSILAVSDLLVLPSDIDGRPAAVLEALSMGLPVVASKVGGLPDIITDGENGYIVKPKDIDGFVEKIKYIQSNPDKYKKMCENSRRYALENLDVAKMKANYVNTITELK